MAVLSDELLGKVVGGALTQEAQDWITRNEEEIRARAKAKGLGGMADWALSLVQNCKEVYDIEKLKNTLSAYIDVSGLV